MSSFKFSLDHFLLFFLCSLDRLKLALNHFFLFFFRPLDGLKFTLDHFLLFFLRPLDGLKLPLDQFLFFRLGPLLLLRLVLLLILLLLLFAPFSPLTAALLGFRLLPLGFFALALFSLPAVLGVEYGIGFGCVTMRGSEHNDLFVPDSDRKPPVSSESNRHGGMLGGITSGLPIVLRAAVKPTSSLPLDQKTVTTTGEETTISTKGRHDPCLLPRFIPMAEAMVAIVLADHWLRWKGQRQS